MAGVCFVYIQNCNYNMYCIFIYFVDGMSYIDCTHTCSIVLQSSTQIDTKTKHWCSIGVAVGDCMWAADWLCTYYSNIHTRRWSRQVNIHSSSFTLIYDILNLFYYRNYQLFSVPFLMVLLDYALDILPLYNLSFILC